MSAKAAIPQADLTRILRAAKAADYPVSVTVNRATGDIVIFPVTAKNAPSPNPWDEADDET